MQFEQLNWSILDRLRAGFLSGSAAEGVYWKSREDLEQYDVTFGERIGWKWDAVLNELTRRGWCFGSRPQHQVAKLSNEIYLRPADQPRLSILDWGCGSGIAGRRVVAFIGSENISQLSVWDHSPLACQFAVERARTQFPGLSVGQGNVNTSADVLVVSHVLNELNPAARTRLIQAAREAQVVIWVEPGTHAVSRELVAVREALRNEFDPIAPCTHSSVCGLLAPENARHWCHAFAPPPPGIYADSDWVKFGQRAGIDLRSLPFSYLVVQKKNVEPLPDRSTPSDISISRERIIGSPRHYKGYVKLLSCGTAGLRELTLQKRTDPSLYKELKRDQSVPIFDWKIKGDHILEGERADRTPTNEAETTDSESAPNSPD